MKHASALEILATTVLIALVILLLNPGHLWMPLQVHVSALACVAVALFVFALMVWREQAMDEREVAHRNFAGRIAYLSGVVIAVVGIMVQSMRHAVDIWLVITLLCMVIAKFLAFYYSRAKR